MAGRDCGLPIQAGTEVLREGHWTTGKRPRPVSKSRVLGTSVSSSVEWVYCNLPTLPDYFTGMLQGSYGIADGNV